MRLCGWCRGRTNLVPDGRGYACAPGSGCAAPRRREPVVATNLTPTEPLVAVAWALDRKVRRCALPFCGRSASPGERECSHHRRQGKRASALRRAAA